MNTVILSCLIAIYSIFALTSSCYAATNIAKGKPYSVFPLQNYPLSAPPTDTTALTDGKYTYGHFWTRPSTVGWQYTEAVEILIDLEKVSSIGSITFGGARGGIGDVHFPQHIAAFVGSDKDHFLYVGDLAGPRDTLEGDYQIKRFVLSDIKAKGRYVLLFIQPDDAFIFCDEIEVYDGEQSKVGTGNLSIKDSRRLFEALKQFGVIDEFIAKLSEKLNTGVMHNTEISGRLNKIKEIMKTLPSVSDVASIGDELLKLRYDSLRAQLPGVQLLVEAVDSWAPLSPITLPSGIAATNISFLVPQGGVGYAAVTVTNLSTDPEKVSFSIDRLSKNVPEIIVYEVPFVKSAKSAFVADPLVPAKDSTTFRSGELKMFFFTTQGIEQGPLQTFLRVKRGKTVISIPIKVDVTSLKLPNKFTLNSVNWSYLDFNPVRTRRIEAVKDLFAHHTNVIVVPPAYIPLMNQPKQVDFDRLESYINLHRGASKIILFMDIRSPGRQNVEDGYQYLDVRWKEAFLKWYEGIMETGLKAGFQRDQIYLYPFDEISENEIRSFISFAKWAKMEIPDVKFYATLNINPSLSVLPYLDIAQIVDRDYMLSSVSSVNGDVWIYDAKGPAKSLSPYLYYRLMAWKAFAGGYKGIGFWAYADTGDSGTAWDDFDGERPDYAVIYEGPDNTIISSRRWEAWRMGIEDYELLTMYAKAKGDGVAKALVKSVLDKPLDTSKADEVRKKILLELSQ